MTLFPHCVYAPQWVPSFVVNCTFGELNCTDKKQYTILHKKKEEKKNTVLKLIPKRKMCMLKKTTFYASQKVTSYHKALYWRWNKKLCTIKDKNNELISLAYVWAIRCFTFFLLSISGLKIFLFFFDYSISVPRKSAAQRVTVTFISWRVAFSSSINKQEP